MPVPVNDMKTLRTYLRSVLSRAKHHAGEVDEIILALAGAIISRKDSTPLQVRSAPVTGLGRALTFKSTRRKRYALSYNHTNQCIDLKQDNFQGPVLHTFTNKTPLTTVATIFAKL